MNINNDFLKYSFYLILFFLGLFLAVYVFNHINAFLGIGLGGFILLYAGNQLVNYIIK